MINFAGTSLQHPKWNSNINTVMATTNWYNFMLHMSLMNRLKNRRLDSYSVMILFVASGQTLHTNRKGTIAREDFIKHECICAHIITHTHTHCTYHCTYLCLYVCIYIYMSRNREINSHRTQVRT